MILLAIINTVSNTLFLGIGVGLGYYLFTSGVDLTSEDIKKAIKKVKSVGKKRPEGGAVKIISAEKIRSKKAPNKDAMEEMTKILDELQKKPVPAEGKSIYTKFKDYLGD